MLVKWAPRKKAMSSYVDYDNDNNKTNSDRVTTETIYFNKQTMCDIYKWNFIQFKQLYAHSTGTYNMAQEKKNDLFSTGTFSMQVKQYKHRKTHIHLSLREFINYLNPESH